MKKWAALQLLAFVFLSSLLILVGMILAFLNPQSLEVFLSQSTGTLSNWQTLISAGIVLLIAAPLFRVLTCLIGFYLEKDKAFVIISLLILALVSASLFVL